MLQVRGLIFDRRQRADHPRCPVWHHLQRLEGACDNLIEHRYPTDQSDLDRHAQISMKDPN